MTTRPANRSAPPRPKGRSAVVLLVLALSAMALSAIAWPVMAGDDGRALLREAKALQSKDLKQSATLALRAANALRAPGDKALRREAQALYCIQHVLEDAGGSLRLAEQGVTEAARDNDHAAVTRFLNCKGYAQELLGRRSDAAVTYEASVGAAQRAGNREVLADALAFRGESRHYHGRYDAALDDLKRAYDLAVAIGSAQSQRYVLNAIANVYSDANVGEYGKAIAYYRQLLRISEAAGEKPEVATALFNIAAALEARGDLNAALVEYRRALEIDTALGDAQSIAEEQLAIGSLLGKQGKNTDALTRIDQALRHFERVGDADSIARARLRRAAVLRRVGRTDEALADLDAAKAHFIRGDNLRYMVRLQEEYADVHAERGDWRKAYLAGRELRTAQARIDKRLREEQTTNLRIQFDTSRKEQENLALQIENAHRGEALRAAERVRDLQRLVNFFAFALLAVLAAIAWHQLHRYRRMRALAMTDELTGLPNRRHILSYLAEKIEDCVQTRRPLSVIAFDIDMFKQVNDQHGHNGGDQVLKMVAKVVADSLRQDDRVGRVGGEEFLLVLPATDLGVANEIAERLRLSVSAARIEGLPDSGPVTISLGVSQMSEGESATAVMKSADEALYLAKRSGRNQVVTAAPRTPAGRRGGNRFGRGARQA